MKRTDPCIEGKYDFVAFISFAAYYSLGECVPEIFVRKSREKMIRWRQASRTMLWNIWVVCSSSYVTRMLVLLLSSTTCEKKKEIVEIL